jgi:hypothetical protein
MALSEENGENLEPFKKSAGLSSLLLLNATQPIKYWGGGVHHVQTQESSLGEPKDPVAVVWY